MRRFYVASLPLQYFSTRRGASWRLKSDGPPLSTHVSRVLAALEALEKQAGHPVSLELQSNGRFVLRSGGTDEKSDLRSVMVDCSWHDAAGRALNVFRDGATANRHASRAASNFAQISQSGGHACHGVPVVLDVAPSVREDLHASQFVRALFPHLELHVDHTTGSDVKDVRTHAHTVSLRRRASGDVLTTEEEDALERFYGSAVGYGYNKTLARAMRAACDAVGRVYGSALNGSSAPQYTGHSVLDMYLSLLRTHAPDASLRVEHCDSQLNPAATPDGSLRGADAEPTALTIQLANAGNTIVERHTDAPEALLTIMGALEAACRSIAPVEAHALAQNLERRQMVVVLPEQRVSVKRLLLRLLDYHFGLAEEQLVLDTTRSSLGLFACVLKLSLHLEDWMPCHGVSQITVSLASGSGTTKRGAAESACVAAIQRLFPDVFAQHVAGHTEISAILLNSKAAEQGQLAPPVSQGLKAQLNWAAEQSGVAWRCTTRHLKASMDYPELGVVVHSPVWCAETIVSAPPNGGSRADGEGTSVTPDVVIRALDSRKSRAEQKSYARALVKCFPERCRDAVAHAVALSLLAPDGALLPCPGVETMPNENDFSEACHTDANLRALKTLGLPFSLVLSSPASEGWSNGAARSLLQRYDDFLMNSGRAVDTDGEPSVWTIDVRFDEGTGQHLATARLIPPLTDSDRRQEEQHPGSDVSYEAYHWSRWAARLAVSQKCAKHQHGADTLSAQLRALLGDAPTSLSLTRPLEQTVEALRRLYGVSVLLRASLCPPDPGATGNDGAEPSRVLVELWGCSEWPCADRPETPQSLPAEEASAVTQSSGSALVARSTATSLLGSVLKCCRIVMTHHVQPLTDVFPKSLIHDETVVITGWHRGTVAILPQLLDCVRNDVEQAAHGTVVSPSVSTAPAFVWSVEAVVTSSGELAHLLFKVQSSTAAVTLETVTDTNLLTALCNLEERVRGEIGDKTLVNAHFVRCGARTFNTHEDALRSLVSHRLGLSIVVDTCSDGEMWHCEISLSLGNDILYLVSRSAADRKSEAAEMAASSALRSFFATDAENISVVGRPASSPQSTDNVVVSGLFFRRLS